MLLKGISYKAIAFGVFQQSLLFPNERINISHGRFDIFMGVFKEELTVYSRVNKVCLINQVPALHAWTIQYGYE